MSNADLRTRDLLCAFVRGLSHSLRSPLAVANNELYVLGEFPEARKATDKIREVATLLDSFETLLEDSQDEALRLAALLEEAFCGVMPIEVEIHRDVVAAGGVPKFIAALALLLSEQRMEGRARIDATGSLELRLTDYPIDFVPEISAPSDFLGRGSPMVLCIDALAQAAGLRFRGRGCGSDRVLIFTDLRRAA